MTGVRIKKCFLNDLRWIEGRCQYFGYAFYDRRAGTVANEMNIFPMFLAQALSIYLPTDCSLCHYYIGVWKP